MLFNISIPFISYKLCKACYDYQSELSQFVVYYLKSILWDELGGKSVCILIKLGRDQRGKRMYGKRKIQVNSVVVVVGIWGKRQVTVIFWFYTGSGSIFETLRLGKPLIVVVNEDLMDNHQSELAEELADRKHLYCARPQTLHQTIADMDINTLLPYSPGDATPVAKHINRFLGFPDDWFKGFYFYFSFFC